MSILLICLRAMGGFLHTVAMAQQSPIPQAIIADRRATRYHTNAYKEELARRWILQGDNQAAVILPFLGQNVNLFTKANGKIHPSFRALFANCPTVIKEFDVIDKPITDHENSELKRKNHNYSSSVCTKKSKLRGLEVENKNLQDENDILAGQVQDIDDYIEAYENHIASVDPALHQAAKQAAQNALNGP